MNTASTSLVVELPSDAIEAIAYRAAEIALERLERRQGQDDGFVTAKGAAEYLGLSTAAVYKLEQRGEVRGYRPNGTLFFARAELAAWVRGTTP